MSDDSSGKTEPSSKELFERWVKAPLTVLRSLPNGDGAFVAMGMAFSLYERFVKSSLAKVGEKETPEQFRAFGAKDLAVETETFSRFWEMYRDGIQHSLQPKRYTSKGVRWGWEVSAAHSKSPKLIEPEADLRIITIDPWQFIDHVLSCYEAAPDLIDFKDTWKFGKIAASPYAEVKTPITWSAPTAPPPSPKWDQGTGNYPFKQT